ncbi:hypothetical protein [Rhizobacter sp. Root404]|uniref:hypothetical protein n=1 Tax=Rhizobacter sp. Root404 TaxID=1736528 RepID=UPI0006F93BB0|nr:hypothetical protein ASC76_07260 [Rhizobacter sp. Root404]
MNLSAIHWVRTLVGGSLLLAWLPVITRPRGPWWPSVVIGAVLLLVLALYKRRARTNALRRPRATTQRDGLRRACYWACRAEGIDPRKPSRLPLLFALDATLGIAGGYVYALDCGLLGADRGTTHCAGDLSSGCGGSSGDSGCGRDERRQAPMHDKARRLVGGARGE